MSDVPETGTSFWRQILVCLSSALNAECPHYLLQTIMAQIDIVHQTAV